MTPTIAAALSCYNLAHIIWHVKWCLPHITWKVMGANHAKVKKKQDWKFKNAIVFLNWLH